MPPKMDPNKLKVRECKILCQSISSAIREDPMVVAPTAPLTSTSRFATRSTVGLMLSGAVIDNMVIGGPAYNCQQLHKGDEIIAVDGREIALSDLYQALVGNDVPGSVVVLRVKKATTKNVEDIVLHRMATELIADKRRMFEIFMALKESAANNHDMATVAQVDTCINLWTKMCWAESDNSRQIAQNVKSLQTQCSQWVDFLQKGLSTIESSMDETSTSEKKKENTLLREQQENERLKEAVKDLEKQLTQSRRTMDTQAEEMTKLRKEMQAMKAQEDSIALQLKQAKALLDKNSEDGVEVRKQLSEAAQEHGLKSELLLSRVQAAEDEAKAATLKHEQHLERLRQSAIAGLKPRMMTGLFEDWRSVVQGRREGVRIAEAVGAKVEFRRVQEHWQFWRVFKQREPKLKLITQKVDRRQMKIVLNLWWRTAGLSTPERQAQKAGTEQGGVHSLKSAAPQLRSCLRAWKAEKVEAGVHSYRASKIETRWKKSLLKRMCNTWYQTTKEEIYLRIPLGKVENGRGRRAMKRAWVHWTGVDAETKRDRRHDGAAGRSQRRSKGRLLTQIMQGWDCLVLQDKCLATIHNAVTRWSNERLLRCFLSEWQREVLVAGRDDVTLQHRSSMAQLEAELRRDMAALQGRLEGVQASKGQVMADFDRFQHEAQRREVELATKLGDEKAQHQAEAAALTSQLDEVKETLEQTRKEFKEHMRLSKSISDDNADKDRRIDSLKQDLEKVAKELDNANTEHTTFASKQKRDMQELNAQLTSKTAELVKNMEESNKNTQMISYRENAIKKLQSELEDVRAELRQERETHEAAVLQYKLEADKLHMELTETSELASDENKTLAKLRETQSILSQMNNVQTETEGKLTTQTAATERSQKLLQEAEAKLASTEKEVNKLKEEVERGKSLLRQEQEEKRKYSGDLDYQGQELGQYKLQLQQARKDLGEAEVSMQQMQNEMEGERKSRKEAASEAERLSEVLDGTQARLQSAEQELNSVRAKLTSSEKELEAELNKSMESRHSAQTSQTEIQTMKSKLAEASREGIRLRLLAEQKQAEAERAKEGRVSMEKQLALLQQEKNSLRIQLQQTGAELAAAMEAWEVKRKGYEAEIQKQKKETESQELLTVKTGDHHRYLGEKLKEQLDQATKHLEAKSHELYTTTIQLRAAEHDKVTKVEELRKWQATCDDLREEVAKEREGRKKDREQAQQETQKLSSGMDGSAGDELKKLKVALSELSDAKAAQAEAAAQAERAAREAERLAGRADKAEERCAAAEKDLSETKQLLDVTRLDLRTQTERSTEGEKKLQDVAAKLSHATSEWTAAQAKLAEAESKLQKENGKAVWLSNEVEALKQGHDASKRELMKLTLAHENALRAGIEKDQEIARLLELHTQSRQNMEIQKKLYDENSEQTKAEAEALKTALEEAKQEIRKGQAEGSDAEKDRQVAKLQAEVEQGKFELTKEKEERAEVVNLMRKESEMLKAAMEMQNREAPKGNNGDKIMDKTEDESSGQSTMMDRVKTMASALEKAESELNRMKQEHDVAYNELLEDHLWAKTQLAAARQELTKVQEESKQGSEEGGGMREQLEAREEELRAREKDCEQYKKDLNIARREASSLLTRLSQTQQKSSAIEAQLEKVKGVYGSGLAQTPRANKDDGGATLSLIDGQSFHPNLDPSHYVACQNLVLRLQDLLDRDFLAPPAPTPSEEYVSSGKTTVGIMLSETFVEGTTFGGPAYNSQHVHRGDVIIQVDKVDVDGGNVKEALVGSDVPGSAVIVTVRRSTGKVSDISLIRMATEDLASRKRMMEQLVETKAGAVASNNGTIAAKMDGIIRLWTQILIADGQADYRVSETVRRQQTFGKELAAELKSALKTLCETQS